MGHCLDDGHDFIKEGRIRMINEDYAAGTVGNYDIWVRVNVVE